MICHRFCVLCCEIVFCLSSSCVFVCKCCRWLLIVYFWLPRRFSLTFIWTTTRRMPLLEQELFPLPIFSGVHVANSIIFFKVFCRPSFCLFSWFHFCLSFDLRLLVSPLLSPNCYCEVHYPEMVNTLQVDSMLNL